MHASLFPVQNFFTRTRCGLSMRVCSGAAAGQSSLSLSCTLHRTERSGLPHRALRIKQGCWLCKMSHNVDAFFKRKQPDLAGLNFTTGANLCTRTLHSPERRQEGVRTTDDRDLTPARGPQTTYELNKLNCFCFTLRAA